MEFEKFPYPRLGSMDVQKSWVNLINGCWNGSPKRWDGRWHSPSPNWQEKYHLYIPLIVLAFWGGYMLPIPSFKGTISTTVDLRVSRYPLKKYSLNSWPYMDEQLITFQKTRKHIPPFMGSAFSNRLKSVGKIGRGWRLDSFRECRSIEYCWWKKSQTTTSWMYKTL